jgi:hypothetical protein
MGIHRPKSARAGVQVARSVVVQPQVGVELFAGEEVIVGRCAGLVDEVAEGVVVVFSGKTDTSPSQFQFQPPEKEKTTTKYISTDLLAGAFPNSRTPRK